MSNKPQISSFDEAMARLQHHLEEECWNRNLHADEISLQDLEPLIREIWDAGVLQGRSEAKKIGNVSGGRRYRDPKRR